MFELSGKHEILSLFYVILRFQPHFPAFPSVLATILCSLCLLHEQKLILKYQTGKDILPIDWRPRFELDSKYNLGSKSYDKTGQVSGQ